VPLHNRDLPGPADDREPLVQFHLLELRTAPANKELREMSVTKRNMRTAKLAVARVRRNASR